MAKFFAEPVDDPGKYTSQQVTAGAAGDITVKAGRGLIGAISVLGSITVTPKDGATQCWNGITSAQDLKFNGQALECKTSIVLNFSAAGSCWILYK